MDFSWDKSMVKDTEEDKDMRKNGMVHRALVPRREILDAETWRCQAQVLKTADTVVHPAGIRNSVVAHQSNEQDLHLEESVTTRLVMFST